MNLDFLTSPSIISFLLGAASLVVAYYIQKFAQSQQLKEVKEAYPVFDLVLAIAQANLKETKYGFMLDAAQSIWQGKGFSPREAREYAKATIKGFDLDKYAGFDIDSLSEEEITQGQMIAESLIPGYKAKELSTPALEA